MKIFLTFFALSKMNNFVIDHRLFAQEFSLADWTWKLLNSITMFVPLMQLQRMFESITFSTVTTESLTFNFRVNILHVMSQTFLSTCQFHSTNVASYSFKFKLCLLRHVTEHVNAQPVPRINSIAADVAFKFRHVAVSLPLMTFDAHHKLSTLGTLNFFL